MKRFPARFHAAWIVFAFCSALLLFSAVSAGATTSYDVWKPDGTGGFTNPPYPGSYVVIDVTLLNPTTAEILRHRSEFHDGRSRKQLFGNLQIRERGCPRPER